LDSGAEKEAKDNEGKTALHIAAHENVAKVLLNSGVKKGARQVDGWTTLDIAACNGRRKVIKVLLSSCANEEVRADRGQTALEWAI
jgi:ankyrin repeat protein